MEYTVENKNKYVLIGLKGEFDTENSHRSYFNMIKKIFNDNNTNIALDLSNILYICSADISVIMQSFRFIESNNGKFVICNCPKLIFSVMKMTRIDTMVNFFNSIEEVEKFFNG